VAGSDAPRDAPTRRHRRPHRIPHSRMRRGGCDAESPGDVRLPHVRDIQPLGTRGRARRGQLRIAWDLVRLWDLAHLRDREPPTQRPAGQERTEGEGDGSGPYPGTPLRPPEEPGPPRAARLDGGWRPPALPPPAPPRAPR